MITTDLNSTLTAAKLNENMFKKFGTKINFEKYTREELENYRNILRTNIHQVETTSNFNDLLSNEDYQKDKYMVGVLNTKIKEMLGESRLLAEKSKSQKQARTMAAAAHDPTFAKKVGIKQSVAKEFNKADKGTKQLSNAMKHKKKASEGIEGITMTTRNTMEAKKKSKPDFLDLDKDGNKKEPMKSAAKTAKSMKEGAKPDFLDLDKDGNKKEPMKKAAADKKKNKDVNEYFYFDDKKGGRSNPSQDKLARRGGRNTPAGGPRGYKDMASGKDKIAKDIYGINGPKGKLPKESMKESQQIFRNHVAIVNESLRTLINEDEEGKAKAITAASDMVNDFTSWMQRVGQYQTKSMIELADSIRAEFGQQESDTFKQAVAPALQSTLETMTQQREAISHAVAVLAGEATDTAMMGGMGGGEVPDMTGGGAADTAMPDASGDEFGASDAAAGGMETSGRELRESRRREMVRQKIAESHKLMNILSNKK
jgi:hypothetical protein